MREYKADNYDSDDDRVRSRLSLPILSKDINTDETVDSEATTLKLTTGVHNSIAGVTTTMAGVNARISENFFSGTREIITQAVMEDTGMSAADARAIIQSMNCDELTQEAFTCTIDMLRRERDKRFTMYHTGFEMSLADNDSEHEMFRDGCQVHEDSIRMKAIRAREEDLIPTDLSVAELTVLQSTREHRLLSLTTDFLDDYPMDDPSDSPVNGSSVEQFDHRFNDCHNP